MARTGRILSRGEEQTKRLLICLACYRQGYTISSRNCPLKLQASIATQSQILLDLDIVATQPLALIVLIVSPVRAILTALIAPAISKQLLPDRPEVLIQAYLAKKTA